MDDGSCTNLTKETNSVVICEAMLVLAFQESGACASAKALDEKDIQGLSVNGQDSVVLHRAQ